MNYENISVNVKSDEKGKIEIQTLEGLLQTYYLAPKRMIYLYGEALQVSMRADPDYFNDDKPDKPIELTRQIEGRVILKEQFISVIGDPKSRSNQLSIVFQPVTSDGREKNEESEQNFNAIPNYTRAWIKCIRLNQKLGNSPEWFAVCAVSPDTLDAIASAVISETLRTFTVGMRFFNIYIDNNDDEVHWADDRQPIKEWFVRPNIHDNTTEFPQDAYGGVTYLDLALTVVDLSQQPNTKTESVGFVSLATPLTEMPPDRYAVALNSIAANIQKLRFVTTWIIGGILLILFALTFK